MRTLLVWLATTGLLATSCAGLEPDACEVAGAATRYGSAECYQCRGSACGAAVLDYAFVAGTPECRPGYDCAQRMGCDPGLYTAPFRCECFAACFTAEPCRTALRRVMQCFVERCGAVCR